AVTMLAQARGIAFRTAELAQAGEVDVVHATNLGGVSLFHPRGVPLVIRLSSDRMLYRKFGSFDHENWVTVWQQHILERRALTRANGIYSPSRRVASVVECSAGKTVKVIPPPVFIEDIAEDQSVIRRTVGKRPFLLFVGRINRLKGIPVLARILGPILERHPDLRMVVAGAEHQNMQDNSMTKDLLLRASPHSDRVILTGVLPHTQLYPFLRRTEAVVLPSLVDNLPNSLLEAMLHGKVVVGTRNASFDELITDGVNGILCEPGNPSSLEQAVERVLTLSPEIRRNMENAARARIAELSPSKIIPRIVSYLEYATTAVSGSGPSRRELVR
ncbi:MAG: hypothetical protein DRH08_14955, partial [Deltaproteobacteria bacterium]